MFSKVRTFLDRGWVAYSPTVLCSTLVHIRPHLDDCSPHGLSGRPYRASTRLGPALASSTNKWLTTGHVNSQYPSNWLSAGCLTRSVAPLPHHGPPQTSSATIRLMLNVDHPLCRSVSVMVT